MGRRKYIYIYIYFFFLYLENKILDKFDFKIQINKKVLYFVGILNRVGDVFLRGYSQVFFSY